MSSSVPMNKSRSSELHCHMCYKLNMSVHISARDKRNAEWWFIDMLGHKGQLPQGNFALVYMKTLMNVAAADGVLDEEERKWVVGFASVVGLREDLVVQLEQYQPGTDPSANNIFNDTDMPYVKSARFGLIFYAFRGASSDGELHPKEAEAIYSIGKKLGISDEKMAAIRALSDEEDKLRQKRASTLYPQGLDESMTNYEKQFS